MELNEASQIHQGLNPTNSKQSSLHDMKAIVKTWRNRLPVISDDLSHWSDVFTWRQHHYKFIANHYNQDQTGADGAQIQVWSLTQSYSVDFSQSRIGVKKCVLNKYTIKVCVSCP